MLFFILCCMRSRTTNLVSGGVPKGTIVDFAFGGTHDFGNNVKTAARPPRLHRGSGGRLIISADQAGLIRLWKEEHGEVESKGHGARSRVQIAAARRKSTIRRLHPVSSVVRRLFKLFVLFINSGSCSRTPTPHPGSGIKINPAGSIADRN